MDDGRCMPSGIKLMTAGRSRIAIATYMIQTKNQRSFPLIMLERMSGKLDSNAAIKNAAIKLPDDRKQRAL